MGENTINGRPVEAREVSALVELIREVDPKLAEEIKGSVSPDHIKRLDINANGVLDIADVLETNTDRKTLDAEIGRFQKLACYLAKYGVKASMACSQQGLPQLLEVYDLPSLYATMSRLYREDPQVKIVVGVGADWCAPCKKYEGTFKNVVTDNDNPHIRMIHFFSVHGSSLGEFDRGGIPLFVQVDPKKYEAIELSHNLLDPLVGLKLKTRTRENEIAFLSKQAGQAWSVIWQPARERLLDLGAMTEKDLGPLFKSDETEDVAWVLAQVEKRFPQKKLEYVRDLLQRNNPAFITKGIEILREMKAEARVAVPEVLAFTDHADAGVRTSAYDFLALFPDESVLVKLRSRLAVETNGDAFLGLVRTLSGVLKDQKSYPLFLNVASQGDETNSIIAAHAAAGIRPDQSAKVYGTLLRHPNPKVRVSAIDVVAFKMKQNPALKKAMPPIILRMTKDRDPAVREAVKAFKKSLQN